MYVIRAIKDNKEVYCAVDHYLDFGHPYWNNYIDSTGLWDSYNEIENYLNEWLGKLADVKNVRISRILFEDIV